MHRSFPNADKFIVFKATNRISDYDPLLQNPGDYLLRFSRFSSNDNDIMLSLKNQDGTITYSRCGSKLHSRPILTDDCSMKKFILLNNIEYPMDSLIFPDAKVADPNGWILTQEGRMVTSMPSYKPNLLKHLPNILWCLFETPWVFNSNNTISTRFIEKASNSKLDQFQNMFKRLKISEDDLKNKKNITISGPEQIENKPDVHICINIDWFYHIMTGPEQIELVASRASRTYQDYLDDNYKYYEGLNEEKCKLLAKELQLAVDYFQYYQRTISSSLPELKKNTFVLTRAMQSGNNIFAKLPKELLQKIIADNSRDVVETSELDIPKLFDRTISSLPTRKKNTFMFTSATVQSGNNFFAIPNNKILHMVNACHNSDISETSEVSVTEVYDRTLRK